MSRDEIKLVVRTTLAVMARLSRRTRTQADDLMSVILKSNEERIVDAVQKLMADPQQPPSEEQIAKALEAVGIKV